MDEKKAISALKLGIVLTSIFFVMELVGGYVSGSLSLLGDAGHMLRDILALVLSLLAINLARRFPTEGRTFGYHRAEVMVALLNGLMLFVISIWIFREAIDRIRDPREIDSVIMFVVAFIGLVINAIIAWKLHGSHDLNVRSAFLHVLTDLLSSVAVIIASVIIFFTGFTIVDPILGILIGIFILISSGKLIWDSVYILLEFTPRNVDVARVIEEMESLEGVQGIHNVHIWTLCSNINVMDAHILTNERDMAEVEEIKEKAKEVLREQNIAHITLEFECLECGSSDRVCMIEH
ncbi:MAG: cation diffusion facilitator family transporter [Thermoplasmatota archaeon]